MQTPRVHPDHPPTPAGDLSGLAIAALFVAVTIAVSIPVITHPLPPLSDYINHLATAHVVDAIGNDPDLNRFYRIEWQPIPNLMMDLVVPVLHRFLDIYVAGRIFTVSIFVGILSGTLVLNRALNGRWSALPLIAAPFLYNGVLLVGVMNYLFGIGLALWGQGPAALRRASGHGRPAAKAPARALPRPLCNSSICGSTMAPPARRATRPRLAPSASSCAPPPREAWFGYFSCRTGSKAWAASRRVEFRHVHVIGAGVMGGDIAAWCALRGLNVTLQDRNEELIKPAFARAKA